MLAFHGVQCTTFREKKEGRKIPHRQPKRKKQLTNVRNYGKLKTEFWFTQGGFPTMEKTASTKNTTYTLVAIALMTAVICVLAPLSLRVRAYERWQSDRRSISPLLQAGRQ
jgi:hypothetical protein